SYHHGGRLLPRLGALEDVHEVVDVADLLAGELHEQVSPLNAGGFRRSSGPHAGDQHSGPAVSRIIGHGAERGAVGARVAPGRGRGGALVGGAVGLVGDRFGDVRHQVGDAGASNGVDLVRVVGGLVVVVVGSREEVEHGHSGGVERAVIRGTVAVSREGAENSVLAA